LNCSFSGDSSAALKSLEELKNKLREELKHELRAISGAGDTAPTSADKPGRKNPAGKGDASARVVDTTDYFELVFECIDTRTNFLNVISLNSRSPVEPDIDLVILQALLNGKPTVRICWESSIEPLVLFSNVRK
jgi:hypothetical protein